MEGICRESQKQNWNSWPVDHRWAVRSWSGDAIIASERVNGILSFVVELVSLVTFLWPCSIAVIVWCRWRCQMVELLQTRNSRRQLFSPRRHDHVAGGRWHLPAGHVVCGQRTSGRVRGTAAMVLPFHGKDVHTTLRWGVARWLYHSTLERTSAKLF